jgi:hypothetical protein
MNLISLIEEYLSGDVIRELSGLLGESESRVGTAASAAVPSLLSSLANVVSGGGAGKVVSALNDLDPGHLGNLRNILTGQSGHYLEKGGSLLTSLLGDGVVGKIVGALGGFAGLAPGVSRKLLSFLTPLVLGVVAGQFKGKTPTAQGLTDLFAQQRSNIAAAMPAGFSLADAPRPSAGVRVTEPARPAAGLPSWLLPLLGLVLLAGILWYLFGRPREATPVVTPSTAPAPVATPSATEPKIETDTVTDAARTATAPDVAALSSDLSDVYSTATKELSGVKDAETAEAAIPRLEKLNETIDRIRKTWETLSKTGRETLTKVTTSGLGKLKDLVAKVLEIPGVGEKLRPILDPMLEKLTALSD